MKIIKRNSVVSIIFDFVDTFLAKRSSKIIILMPGGKINYNEKGISEKKIFWISNGVEYKEKIELKKSLTNKKLKLTYMGSMGPSNSLETIMYAMNYLNKFEMHKN